MRKERARYRLRYAAARVMGRFMRARLARARFMATVAAVLKMQVRSRFN